jgi:hypothetical protein
MKIKLYFLTFLILTATNYTQTPLPEGLISIPEGLLSTPVFIQLANGGSATGFYYSDSSNFYLVTAKHVFFDTRTNLLNCEKADLISYPRDPYHNSYNLLKCDLKYLLDRKLVRYHKQFDVAIAVIGNQIKIDSVIWATIYNDAITKPNPKNSRTNPFTIENILTSKDLPVGIEVHIFGYPTSLGIKEMPQLELTQPLLRRGIVAGKNAKLNTIILDCPVYFGNSGGPVVATITNGVYIDYRLIGIVSQFVPFEDKLVSDRFGFTNISVTNSGYSIIAPIEIMLDLIKEFK